MLLLGVALLVVLANLFVRLSLESEREREQEERNRERGVWPDEPARGDRPRPATGSTPP